jgi:Chaperone of endosialidase
VNALLHNGTGNLNTAGGANALLDNTLGNYDTACGSYALLSNTTGNGNTASGGGALINNISGGNNTALGIDAGSELTTGSNNIDIGNAGLAAESNTIRIGTRGTQTAAYIAGISNVNVTGAAVEVNTTTGQLGIMMSSARFKHDVRGIGDRSSALLKLRPVSFRYNNDPADTLQYGLVAEEVAKVYPELVVWGPDGKVMTVRYSMLSAMLLNELQKQTHKLDRQADQIRRLSAQLIEEKASRKRELEALENTLIGRLAVLEQAVTKTSGAKLMAAFDK